MQVNLRVALGQETVGFEENQFVLGQQGSWELQQQQHLDLERTQLE